MASLPPGDAGSTGLASVEACVRGLEKVGEKSEDDIAKSDRQLGGLADDLTHYCDPMKNPSSYRRCQEAAQGASEGLLALAVKAQRSEAKVSALIALARISFGNPSNAASVAASDWTVHVANQAFRPITEFKQQQEQLAMLQMVQAMAATVPEAPVMAALLPMVVGLLVDGQEGHPSCRAVKATAVDVLTSCALARPTRKAVAKLLQPDALQAMLLSAGCDEETRGFPTGLLLATLCDLAVPGRGEEVVRFGDVGRPFWEQTDFYSNLGSCLLAALRAEQWPPQTGIFHRPWKLARACRELSLAGFAADLAPSVAPLVSLVERRATEEGDTDADAVTASHLAAVALRGLAGSPAAAAAAAQMLEAPRFLDALERIKGEEDAARQLLELLQDGGSAFSASPAGEDGENAAEGVASPVEHEVASGSPF